MKKLYIVIPKFNGEKETEKCLASLQLIKIPKGWEIKVIVVDNSKKIQNPKSKNPLRGIPSECQNKFKIKNSKIKNILWKYLAWWQANPVIDGEVIASSKWREIDYISGCAMMIKRRVFEKIGLFDERYFLYFEDADFCLRAKKAGFKIAVDPKSMVIHKLKEGKKKPLWQRWQLVKSNLIFINRWICWWRKPLAWGFWLERGIKILIG